MKRKFEFEFLKEFLKNFATDLGSLRAELMNNRYNIGDFEFARHGVGTGFEAFVVLGESCIIPLDEQREMTSERPSTVMVTVPGAGHDVHLDAPDALRTVLTDLLERCP